MGQATLEQVQPVQKGKGKTKEMVRVTSPEEVEMPKISEAVKSACGLPHDDVKLLDEVAEQYLILSSQEKELEDRLKATQKMISNLDTILRKAVENKKNGERYDIFLKTKRRAIGKPSPEALDALKDIDPRLVRLIPGEVLVVSPDRSYLLRAINALKAQGLPAEVKDPMKAPITMAIYDDVLKQRRDLWEKVKEIEVLLDIKETTEVKVASRFDE